MTYEHLIVREEGAALWVTMNRPERLNALNRKLVDELRDLFTGLYWRHDVRVVVLGGAGRGFCAGLDLKERDNSNTTASVSGGLVSQRKISEIVMAMRRCPQPIVAMVNGPASGGGFALALASDLRIATPTARMNAAFIRIGLSACDIGVSYFLPRMIGASAASEFMLTGRFIDAERGRAPGVVCQRRQRRQTRKRSARLRERHAPRHTARLTSDQRVLEPRDRRGLARSRDCDGRPQPDPLRAGRGLSRRHFSVSGKARAKLHTLTAVHPSGHEKTRTAFRQSALL
jgi:enoyl-CoA hydratase/carnithine racemase